MGARQADFDNQYKPEDAEDNISTPLAACEQFRPERAFGRAPNARRFSPHLYQGS
jgi:hypothetical protein